MGIRKEGLAAVERIVKRRLARYNLDLLKPQRMNPKIEAHGGYKVRDAATGKVVLGETGYEFSAELDDIDAWLSEREANEKR